MKKIFIVISIFALTTCSFASPGKNTQYQQVALGSSSASSAAEYCKSKINYSDKYKRCVSKWMLEHNPPPAPPKGISGGKW